MKLLVPRAELKEAILGLSKVVNPRSSLPVLSHVRIDADKSLRLTGTDLEQTVTYELIGHASLPKPLSVLVPLESLQSLLKSTQGPTIELEPAGEDEVVLGSTVGGQLMSRRIPTPSLDEWPVLPEPATTTPVDSKLLEHIRQAIPFASEEDSRHTLQSIYLDVSEPACHKVVSTDGRRLTVLNSAHLPLADSVILPTSKFLAWSKLTGEVQIGTDKTRETLTITAGPWTYITRLIDGVYPNFKQVIPSGKGLTSLALSEEDAELLIKAIPGLPPHDGGPDALVLCVQPNGARVYTRETVKASENSIMLTSSQYSGKSIVIGFSRDYFREALTAGFRLFDLFDANSPLVGRLSPEDRHSSHVLMPLRLVDGEAPASTGDVKPAASTPTTSIQPKKETPMPKSDINPTPEEACSLDKVLAAYEIAKTAVRQANTALLEVANAVREAIREDKARRREINDVRAGLAKLKSIKV